MQGKCIYSEGRACTQTGQNTKNRSQVHVLKAAPLVYKCITNSTGDASGLMETFELQHM